MIVAVGETLVLLGLVIILLLCLWHEFGIQSTPHHALRSVNLLELDGTAGSTLKQHLSNRFLVKHCVTHFGLSAFLGPFAFFALEEDFAFVAFLGVRALAIAKHPPLSVKNLPLRDVFFGFLGGRSVNTIIPLRGTPIVIGMHGRVFTLPRIK